MVAVRKVGRVYCFQSPSATVDFRPSRFVAIDDEVERKLMAIRAFASQVEVRAYLDADMIRSTARYWSRFGDGQYAEAFEVIREAATPAAQPAGPAPGVAAARPGGGPAVTLDGGAGPAGQPPEPARVPGARPEVPHATP
jgi:hypothetical protein